MSFRTLALVQFSQKALGLPIAIGLAFLLESYWAIIIGNALGAGGAAALSFALMPYRPSLTLKHVREIWSFSGWMFFNQLFETINWRIDQLIIGLVVPKGQLGIYAMADNFAVIPTRETMQPVKHALFPGLANLSHDMARLTRSHLKAQSTIAMLIAPLGFGLALVADPAVRIALGDQWLAAIPFVEICAIFYSVGTFSMGLQPVAMAMGRTKVLFIRQIVAVFIKIPLIVAGLVWGGLIGAALGRFASELLSVLVEFLFLRHLLHLSVWHQVKQHGFTILGLVAMALGVELAGSFLGSGQTSTAVELVGKMGAGGAFYAGAIMAAWILVGRPDGPVQQLKELGARLTNRPTDTTSSLKVRSAKP